MQLIKMVIRFLIIILSIILVFILVNLLIGGLKFGSFPGYFNMLENTKWDSVTKDISWNPTSRVGVFYYDTDNPQVEIDIESEELLKNLDEILPRDIDSTQLVEDELNDDLFVEPTFQTGLAEVPETGKNSDNPYDPDFEDEFNSFFAGE